MTVLRSFLLHPGPRLSFGTLCRGCWAGDWGRGLQRGHVCVAPVVREPACAPGGLEFSSAPEAAGAAQPGPRRQTIRPPSHRPGASSGTCRGGCPGPGFPRKGEPWALAQEPLHSATNRLRRPRSKGRNQGNAPRLSTGSPAAESQHKSLYTGSQSGN